MKNTLNKGSIIVWIVIVILAILLIVGFTSKKSDNNTLRGEDQSQSGPTLTQTEAETLVSETWGECVPGECGDVVVTITQNDDNEYVVTAIFGELDDSTSQTKKVSMATYQNETWKLGQPIITRMCHRGNVDNTVGWTAGLCI